MILLANLYYYSHKNLNANVCTKTFLHVTTSNALRSFFQQPENFLSSLHARTHAHTQIYVYIYILYRTNFGTFCTWPAKICLKYRWKLMTCICFLASLNNNFVFHRREQRIQLCRRYWTDEYFVYQCYVYLSRR